MISSIEPENMGMGQDIWFASINGLNGGINIHGNQLVLAVYYQGTSVPGCNHTHVAHVHSFYQIHREKSEKWEWNPSSINMGIEENIENWNQTRDAGSIKNQEPDHPKEGCLSLDPYGWQRLTYLSGIPWVMFGWPSAQNQPPTVCICLY